MKKNEVFEEYEKVIKIVQQLMQFPCYKNRGQEIFALVGKAMSIGMSISEALSGGLNYTKSGKVEMPALTMHGLIRAAGHKINVKSSNNEGCEVVGVRADTGEEMCVCFSKADAQKAGLTTGAWITFPQDMYFARALSRLARRLFPDVIKMSYTTGEIPSEPEVEKHPETEVKKAKAKEEKVEAITEVEAKKLQLLLNSDNQFEERVKNFLERANIKSIRNLPRAAYDKIILGSNLEEKALHN